MKRELVRIDGIKGPVRVHCKCQAAGKGGTRATTFHSDHLTAHGFGAFSAELYPDGHHEIHLTERSLEFLEMAATKGMK